MSLNGTAQTEYASLSGKIHSLVIDKSLTISGACADAKAVGDAIADFDKGVDEAKEAYDKAVADLDKAFSDAAYNLDGYTKLDSLSNSTKEKFGLSEAAVPDNVLNYLGRYNQHWWSRTKNEPYYSVGESRTLNLYWASSRSGDEVSYADEIELDATNGAIRLVNPSTTLVSWNLFETEQAKKLLGKYVTDVHDGGVWYIDEDATYEAPKTNDINGVRYCCRITSGAHLVTGYVGGSIEHVTSADRNTYPDSGESDGFKWEYHGIPFDNAVTVPKVEYVSYVGTGTYGASNPVNLNFSFPVKLLIWCGYKYTSGGTLYFIHPCTSSDASEWFTSNAIPSWDTTYRGNCGFGREVNNSVMGKRSEDGKSVWWYQTEKADYMCNVSDYEYFFVAIG